MGLVRFIEFFKLSRFELSGDDCTFICICIPITSHACVSTALRNSIHRGLGVFHSEKVPQVQNPRGAKRRQSVRWQICCRYEGRHWLLWLFVLNLCGGWVFGQFTRQEWRKTVSCVRRKSSGCTVNFGSSRHGKRRSRKMDESRILANEPGFTTFCSDLTRVLAMIYYYNIL